MRYPAAVICRIAETADINEICRIETLPEYRSFIGAWSAEEHRLALANPDIQQIVLPGENGRLDGYAILQGIRSEHRSLELKRLAVAEPGRGLGRVLLADAAERAFLHHGAHRLWLDVFETNIRARHVYERFGFRVDGVFREAVLRDGEFHSQLLMSILEDEYRSRHAV